MSKEKWIKLGYEDIALVLAQDEIEKLDSLSLSSDISSVCQQLIDVAANAFRYTWMSKGYNIDKRDCYIPKGYAIYVLNYARPFIASRFPNSKEIFIDEIREKLFDEAKEVLKEGYIGVPDPDYSDDPELSGEVTDNSDYAMTIPFLRILSKYGEFGFPGAYNKFEVYKDDLSAY